MKQRTITRLGSKMTELASTMNRKLSLATALCCALAVVWAGCTTQQQQQGRTRQTRVGSTQQQQQRQKPAPAPQPAAAPAPAPAIKVGCSDPTWGLIRMTKTMPREVSLGSEFATDLSIIAQACAGNVIVLDKVPDNASYVRSEPAATVSGNQLTWKIGDMDAGQTLNAKIWFKANKEGTLVNCATVSADPRVCGATLVVNPAIQLTKTEPAEVTVCEPIPMTLTVKNSGSSSLTGVKVTDSLPAGLTSDGRSSVVFDAGSLAAGESKEFKFNATAAQTGKYVNTAQATSDQGVGAKASASTVVHQAVLKMSCKAPEQQFIGRAFEVCFTVSNSGDTAAAGTQVVLPIPAGLTFSSATAGGRVSGSTVVWDLGALAVNASTPLCATFASPSAGTFSFNPTAKGTCAAPVTTTCQTKVVGIAAILLEKADNPDPVAIGGTTTYTVKITNQGSADDTNVRMVVTIAPELAPVSATGGTIDGQTVTFPAVPRLAAKAAVSYTIVARGVKAGDGHTKFTLSSEVLKSPISAEESTTVY